MIGTFIYNSSGPNNPPSGRRQSTNNCNKKHINNSENYDIIQSQDILQQMNKKKDLNRVKKQREIPNMQSSCSIGNDLSDFSQYASGIAITDSSINSCIVQSTTNNIHDNSEQMNSNSSIESICIENAKLKTKLEEMGEREDDMKILAEENEKLRRACIKLNVELEKFKATSSITPQYQNFTLSNQIQELKEEIKNKAKLIAQFSKQQEVLSNENEKLKLKVIKQKELFNKLTESSTHLIAENERLQALFQEQKKKSIQKKEEIKALMVKVEKNEPVVNHQVLQSLNDQVEKLEKSFGEIQAKNDRLAKENVQLKEQILLYQQIDSKMQTENNQLKEKIIELSQVVHNDNFDNSKFVSKSAFDELNSSFIKLQQQMENRMKIQQNYLSKEIQCTENIKEEQMKKIQIQFEEMKLMKEKIENQYILAKEEINQLNKKIVANEQISYENAQLRERNISLSNKLAEFASFEKLELENNTLKQENAKLKEALDQASQISEIKDLVYENGYGYEKDNTILTNENEELKNELEDARNRLSSIMNVLKKCSIEKIIPEM